MSPGWRATARSSALVLLIAGIFTLHTSSRGKAELAAAEQALVAGEPERSVRHAGHAAGAAVPGARHMGAAYALLERIALDAERNANAELAASAWQAMRGAALGSAHLWQPRAAQLALANANLARLGGFSSSAAAELELPAVLGSMRLLLALGFLGAIGALSWFCSCAWSESGRWQPARSVWPVLAWCVSSLVLGWALLHA